MRDAASLCCLALAITFGGNKLVYPDSPAYAASLDSYFSVQQESIRPACIFSPQTAGDVSTAVTILSVNGSCKFAVRAGGHTSFEGASNIANGVTFDLRNLNSVDIKNDSKTVQVGSGATWDAVYRKLDPLGRTVAGGRVAGVGVGGLTLGGGISHLSPRYGWTCDTVRNFQVVLSSGAIVNANVNQNPDLFFALKGGGNNFGIVTRIDFDTFSQGRFWSAQIITNTSFIDTNIKEFVRISAAKEFDKNASMILSFGFFRSPITVNTLVYTEPIEDPPIYKEIMNVPPLSVTKGLKNATALAVDGAVVVPKGVRSLYRTITIVPTEAILKAVHDLWLNSTNAVKHIPNISWSLSFDPVPTSFYAPNAASNALGLTGRNGNALLVALLTVRWSNSTDDSFITSTATTLIDDIKRKAQDLSVYDPFVYLNYAGKDQAPIASYGKQNVQKLRATRSRVDPPGMFTKQVPGGHKIPVA